MKTAQTTVSEFVKTSGLQVPAEIRLLDLVSEVGEVAKDFLTATEYGTKPLSAQNSGDDIAGELGDVAFSLLALADALDVDLTDALQRAMAKYSERIYQRGTASSEG